jgi:hypothetical protein
MNDGPNATWLPNLVGGVSIWKLAVDLNEKKFFDGSLLVPETEGSESLPVTVRWDLTNLVPLNEARAKYGPDVDAAIKDFQGALERTAKVFSTKDSGFDKYKQAFTVPSVEADDGGNYFYSPEKKKLYVINWGASPRSMAGRAEFVFGYEDWGRAFKDKGAIPAAATSVSALAAAAPAAAAGGDKKKEDEKKKEEEDKNKDKKDDGKKRPWWVWPLFALIAIVLVLLALFLLKTCEEQNAALADGGEAGMEAAADGPTDGPTDGAMAADALAEGGDAAGAGDAAADAAGGDGGDAGADAAGGDGGDAGKDGGKDAGKDGGTASNDDDDDGDDDDTDVDIGPDGKPKPGSKVIISMGGAPGGNAPAAKKAPHRRHYQADAVKWRVSSGNEKVTRTETRGKRFDVWLAKGKTFNGVTVEWQDKQGKWHVH